LTLKLSHWNLLFLEPSSLLRVNGSHLLSHLLSRRVVNIGRSGFIFFIYDSKNQISTNLPYSCLWITTLINNGINIEVHPAEGTITPINHKHLTYTSGLLHYSGLFLSIVYESTDIRMLVNRRKEDFSILSLFSHVIHTCKLTFSRTNMIFKFILFLMLAFCVDINKFNLFSS